MYPAYQAAAQQDFLSLSSNWMIDGNLPIRVSQISICHLLWGPRRRVNAKDGDTCLVLRATMNLSMPITVIECSYIFLAFRLFLLLLLLIHKKTIHHFLSQWVEFQFLLRETFYSWIHSFIFCKLQGKKITSFFLSKGRVFG